jgi:hypothetical protein
MDETMPVNLAPRPEVAAFVAEVRARLADLPPEERQELTDGLEADLSDLVGEAGPEALGDPDAYTRELRAAAGLDPVTVRVAGDGRPRGERVAGLLDASHARWERAAGGLPGRPWEFVQTLRPVWWVARAWVAVELLDLWFGGSPYAYVPRIEGFGLVLTVLAVVASAQVGRGRLWPGTRVRSSVGARVLLLGLNLFALVLGPVVLDELDARTSYATSYSEPVHQTLSGTGVRRLDGSFVENIYPYDAEGHPLTGVQLYDERGEPLLVTRDPGFLDTSGRFVVRYPWRNGESSVWNAFPMPERTQDGPSRSTDAFDDVKPPALKLPLAAVPPVRLPGIEASTLVQDPKTTFK